jgi:hypothetical protein
MQDRRPRGERLAERLCVGMVAVQVSAQSSRHFASVLRWEYLRERHTGTQVGSQREHGGRVTKQIDDHAATGRFNLRSRPS